MNPLIFKKIAMEGSLNAPAFSIGRHQMLGGVRRSAGGQTPRFLHVFGMDAYKPAFRNGKGNNAPLGANSNGWYPFVALLNYALGS
jgi:hypothetical protein